REGMVKCRKMGNATTRWKVGKSKAGRREFSLDTDIPLDSPRIHVTCFDPRGIKSLSYMSGVMGTMYAPSIVIPIDLSMGHRVRLVAEAIMGVKTRSMA